MNDAVDTPVTEVAAPEEKKPTSSAMALRPTGGFSLATLDDQMRFAKKLLDEKMISDTFKTASQVIIAIQYAKAMNIEPVIALRSMYVVNGRPCLYGDGPLSLVQRHPSFHSIEEFFIDSDGVRISFENKNLRAKVFGSITRVKRKGDPQIQEDYFTLEDMDRAGLDKNKWGKKDTWEKFERIMLRTKSRSMALKSKFADLISGVPIAEYDFHFSPETPEITGPTTRSAADEIDAAYLDAPTKS